MFGYMYSGLYAQITWLRKTEKISTYAQLQTKITVVYHSNQHDSSGNVHPFSDVLIAEFGFYTQLFYCLCHHLLSFILRYLMFHHGIAILYGIFHTVELVVVTETLFSL